MTMRAALANAYGGTVQILRRRHALEDPSRNVVFRPVAGTVEAARPICPEVGARDLKRIIRLERAERGAAEVGAHGQTHPVFGIAGAHGSRMP